jgi:hypothetical protein
VTTADYDVLIHELKLRYQVHVHRWRRTMSGAAWAVLYADGTTINWIEAPLPRSPLSLAIFLHEIGHHQIGFYTFKRRCEEEHHAWQWALREMGRLGIEPDARVLNRVQRSMEYALDKAVRRGLSIVPEPLQQYACAA